MSLLLMCQFVSMFGLKYSWYVNSDREHGWLINPNKVKGYLVIAADFTISLNELNELVVNDVVVLSTDHHETGKEFQESIGSTSEGIVINNQYEFEPDEDRYLSGAGVFYELICEIYPEFASKEREAIVGITLLSDIRQIENKKARKYLRTTYSISTDNQYVKYLIDNTLDYDFGFGTPKLDRNFIDYTLSPFINALLRFDKTSEAVRFILGYGLEIHSMRDAQKDLLAIMADKAQISKYPNITYIVINALDYFNTGVHITSFLGYLCNDYKNKNGGTSVLGMVVENGKVIRASFRGRYDDIHYRSSFRQLGINARGHAGAFGIKDFQPDAETWMQLSDLVGDLENDHISTYKVIETSNLAGTLLQKGSVIAEENCYVRDMYRTYIRYKGSHIKEVKHTYKMEEFSDEDYIMGRKADCEDRNGKYKYIRDDNGVPVSKYIEYTVDGRRVKSFGVELTEKVLILPILEKGYVQLYVRNDLE